MLERSPYFWQSFVGMFSCARAGHDNRWATTAIEDAISQEYGWLYRVYETPNVRVDLSVPKFTLHHRVAPAADNDSHKHSLEYGFALRLNYNGADR